MWDKSVDEHLMVSNRRHPSPEELQVRCRPFNGLKDSDNYHPHIALKFSLSFLLQLFEMYVVCEYVTLTKLFEFIDGLFLQRSTHILVEHR